MSSAFRSSARNGSQPITQALQSPLDWPTARRSDPRDGLSRVVAARAGDHPSIHRFLLATLHQPSAVEFQAQLDAPHYSASDRLLVLRGHQIVSHLRLSNQELHFGSLQLPSTSIHDLATLPEYRGRGCATALLAAAERVAREAGAQLMVVRTTQPKFFARRGWFVWGRHSFSVAGPREILSQLSAMRAARPTVVELAGVPEPAPLNIRIWRHVEQSALQRLYAQNTLDAYGALRRTPAHWQWLISRRGHDRIYVAIDGPDRLEMHDELTPIVGYAAMKGERLAELMTSPTHPDAAQQLLARACGDAIEQESHPVRVDAPPNHPLHQILAQAGGVVRQGAAENGAMHMAKLFDPPDVLAALSPQILDRARRAALPVLSELGIQTSTETLRIVLTRHGARLESGKLGRNYLVCQQLGQLSQLLLGHLDPEVAVDQGRLKASTRTALRYANALFPRLPLWFPQWDGLPA